MQHYRSSFVFTAICFGLAGYWGHHSGFGLWAALWVTFVLSILEISLSFDNAVVNASILKTMDAFWQKMFLTVGILIAVFGMRLVFPIVIVAVVTGLGFVEVINLALKEPVRYGQVLTSAYPMIAAFGGSFLLMVFFNFIFDLKRKVHWLGTFERYLAAMGKLDSLGIVLALIVAVAISLFVTEALRFHVLLSGVAGVMLFIIINSLDGLFEMAMGTDDSASGSAADLPVSVARNGLMGFLYLEVLDASFSFDGVIGAFAITRDVVIIMLGLAVGAMFVRSITIALVRRGTLGHYIYLEHGAMYAIGVLAVIMLIGVRIHVPEVVTGCIGAAFICAAFYSSLRHRRRNAGNNSADE